MHPRRDPFHRQRRLPTQANRDYLPAGLLSDLGQRLDKTLPVNIVQEHVLPAAGLAVASAKGDPPGSSRDTWPRDILPAVCVE